MNKECFILGGGNSLKDFDFSILEGKDVITVNKSLLSYPQCKYFITMDHSFLGKLDKSYNHLKQTSATKIFIANLCPPYMEEKDGRIIDTRWTIIYNLRSFDMIIKSRNQENIGFDFKDFRHGNNSGYCALQLAIILGYKEINLLGLDLNTDDRTHYHGGYGEGLDSFNVKLEEYFQLFKNGILQLQKEESDIKIYSCSKSSRLNSILKYKEL